MESGCGALEMKVRLVAELRGANSDHELALALGQASRLT
jgi:hypothetical protein